MSAEISCAILIAANDRCGGAGSSFATPKDVDAAVMVYAPSPRGSYFEFTARAWSERLGKTPLLTIKTN